MLIFFCGNYKPKKVFYCLDDCFMNIFGGLMAVNYFYLLTFSFGFFNCQQKVLTHSFKVIKVLVQFNVPPLCFHPLDTNPWRYIKEDGQIWSNYISIYFLNPLIVCGINRLVSKRREIIPISNNMDSLLEFWNNFIV